MESLLSIERGFVMKKRNSPPQIHTANSRHLRQSVLKGAEKERVFDPCPIQTPTRIRKRTQLQSCS